jgi:hypothetical protein
VGTKKDYNKRITRTVGAKEVPAHRCVSVPTVKVVGGELQADGTVSPKQKVMYTSDRAYLVSKDGSIRSLKNKMSKKERRLLKAEQEKHLFKLTPPVSMKVSGEQTNG